MVHTAPDYTMKYKQNTIYSVVDNAELVARSSKYFSVDRRGNVVWYDDFETAASTRWVAVADTIGTAAPSTDRAWTGDTSMKIVTAAVVDDGVTVVKAFSGGFSHRAGVEIWFTITGGKPFVYLTLVGYSGTYYYEAGLRFNENNGRLYYENDTSAYTEITKDDHVYTDREHWVPMKVVVDWDLREYVRVIFGGTEYDLTGVPLYAVLSGLDQNIRPQFRADAATAAVATVYFDNFMLTQNE